jgi:hypothetical protein
VKNTPVDIMQKCAALFNQEDTLAWFDFQCAAGGGPAAEGLCRIAHPKKSTGGKEYVSLVFVMDTPDAAAREQAVAGLKRLGSGALETALPEIFSVVSVPPASCPQQIYIKQFDLMLKEMFTASQEFIALRLYPALKDVPGLSAGELGWWEDMRKEKSPAPASLEAEQQNSKSFIARLQEKLFSK